MLLQHVCCALRRHKARALATVLGYGLAVSSLMVLAGVLRISGQGSAAILDGGRIEPISGEASWTSGTEDSRAWPEMKSLR